MGNCQRIKFLFKLIPLKSLQYALLQSHLLKCDTCLKDLADIDEAKSVTISKAELADIKNLRPRFVKDFEQRKQKKKVTLRPAWRWALGATTALALTFGLIFLATHSPRKEDLDDIAVKLTIDYIKIYEEPAQAFIFQTQDASKTFVWVEKLSKGEMP